MQGADKEVAKAVMAVLRKHPLWKMFSFPLEDSPYVDEEFLDIIKNPTDLLQIEDHIEKNKYSSLKQWKHEVDTVWENIHLYFGDDSIYAISADELRGAVDRELSLHKIKGWCERVQTLKDRLAVLIETNPVSKNPDQCPVDLLLPLTTQLMGEDDMKWIIKAANYMESEKEQKEMVRLIRTYQPSILDEDGKQTLNLTELTPTTAYHLKFYLTERLKAKGIQM